jgi:hypothetical protein
MRWWKKKRENGKRVRSLTAERLGEDGQEVCRERWTRARGAEALIPSQPRSWL